MSASRTKNKTSSSSELEVRVKVVPPAEIESAPLPPEGNALSAELWGPPNGFMIASNSNQRKIVWYLRGKSAKVRLFCRLTVMRLMFEKQAYSLLSIALLAWLATLIVGCSALSSPDPAVTLQAGRADLELEATSIAQSAQAQATEVRATVSAGETLVAQGEAVNNQLLVTMRAVFPPTQQIVQNNGAVTPGSVASPAPPGMLGEAATPGAPVDGSNPVDPVINSNTPFTDVGTALTVRDADGCSMGLVTAFAADVQRIYVTTRALNIRAGTVMRVQWNYEGQPSFSESFTVAQDDDDFCLWFYIEPTNATFDAGTWSVQLFANESPINDPLTFTIGM